MNTPEIAYYIVAAVIAGYILGILTAWFFKMFSIKSQMYLAEKLVDQSSSKLGESLSLVTESMKANFADISLNTLAKSNTELVRMAKAQLGSERDLTVKEVQSQKKLIDHQAQYLSAELEKIRGLVKELETDREKKFGELTTTISHTNEQTQGLLKSTQQLTKILGHSRDRGQWGERVAEDILDHAGFIEHVNFVKQSHGTSNTRPDFTFLLPGGKNLNMDVKFPLDNFRRYVTSENDHEKENLKKQFLRDVRLRTKEITTRDYINLEEHTLDLVLLFIPNEQVFSIIMEDDPEYMDWALRQKVVVCSPISLFPILAIIRQAVDQFSLEKQSNLILKQLGLFKKNWEKFFLGFEKLGKRINDIQKEYDALSTTRARQLEKPLEKLEELRIAGEEENSESSDTKVES